MIAETLDEKEFLENFNLFLEEISLEKDEEAIKLGKNILFALKEFQNYIISKGINIDD